MAGPAVASHGRACYLMKFVSNTVSQVIPVTSRQPASLEQPLLEKYREEKIHKLLQLLLNLIKVDTKGKQITIGSGPCDIVVDCKLADEEHCTLMCTRKGWYLMDLKSKYGTFINQFRLPPNVFYPLPSPSVIFLGAQDGWSAIFQFLLKPPIPYQNVIGAMNIDFGTFYILTDNDEYRIIPERAYNKMKEMEDKYLQNFEKSKSIEEPRLIKDKPSTSGLHVKLSESKTDDTDRSDQKRMTEDTDLQNIEKSKSIEEPCLIKDKPSTSGLHVKLSESKTDDTDRSDQKRMTEDTDLQNIEKSKSIEEPRLIKDKPSMSGLHVKLSESKTDDTDRSDQKRMTEDTDLQNIEKSKSIEEPRLIKDKPSMSGLHVKLSESKTDDTDLSDQKRMTEDTDLQNIEKSKYIEEPRLSKDKPSTSGLHVKLSESKNSPPHPPKPDGIHKGSNKKFDNRKLKDFISKLKNRFDTNASGCIKSAVMKKLNKSDNYSEPHPQYVENKPVIHSPAELNGILSDLESNCDPNNSYISKNTSNRKSESITFVTVDDIQDETSDPLPKLKSVDCHQEIENYPFTSDNCSKSAMMKTTWNKSNNSELVLDPSAKIGTSDSICSNVYKDSSRVCPGLKRRHEISSSDDTCTQKAISDSNLSASTLPEYKSFDCNNESKPSICCTKEEQDEFCADLMALKYITIPVNSIAKILNYDSGNSSNTKQKGRYKAICSDESMFHNVEDKVEDASKSSMEEEIPNNAVSCFQSSPSLPDFKSFCLNDGNKPSTSGTAESSLSLDNILVSHITTALHEDINSERQKAASSDEAVIIDVVPHSSISESDGLRVIIQKKFHEDTFVLSLSIPKLFDYPQEDLKRILDEALKHIYEIDILDGLENLSVSYLWHHNNQSINIHYTSNEEFGHHKLTSYIYSYEKASARNALEMKYGEQEFVSSDCCLSNKSVINDADFPVVFPLRDLSSFACITPEVIENVNESEDNNLPHPQHPSNWFNDIPHRSNEGYDHELTSNISSCEKVSVTNALETISGEQKDRINVAIYSSFPAIDSLKPKIRSKLSGGKKKLPNQNSSNIQFAFSELFDHLQEKYRRNMCAASECRSLVIGDVCELENDTVPNRNNEIEPVDIPQTCNEDFNPCTTTSFVSGFEKLYVGNIEEGKNPSFDNGILNEAVFNDVVHSPMSAIDSLESRNDERKFSRDKLDSKPIEPLQESSGNKQSVGFNRTSSSMEKHKMTSSDLGAYNSINCISKGREILDAGKSCDDDAYSKAAETHIYMEESESDPSEVKLQKTMLAIERTEREIQEMKFADYKKRVSEKGVQNMIHYLTCLICKETLQEAMLLSCKHMFCKLCIEQWAEKIGICPVCKEDINYLMNDTRINDFNRSYEHLNPEFQHERAFKFVREKIGESLSFLLAVRDDQIESSNNEEKVSQLDEEECFRII